MASLNSVCFTGNLTRDPEVRETGTGKSVCSFGIAVNGYKDDDTVFLVVVAWGKTAEACGEYLEKGSPVAVKGRLQQRKWEDKQGNKRTAYEVVADGVTFLGKKKGGGSSSRRRDETGLDEEVPF